MWAIHCFRKLMWGGRTSGAIAAFVVIATCFSFPSGLRADENEQRAISILTTGYWYEKGTKPAHVMVFKPDGTVMYGALYGDGTFSNRPGFGGKWTITGAAVVVTFPPKGPKLSMLYLPIDAGGTRSLYGSGPTGMMIQGLGITKITGPDNKRPSAPGGTPTPSAPSSAFGQPRVPTDASTPALPVAPEVQQSASTVIQTYHNDLVFVTGQEGAGSGFIAAINGGNFLVTNVHVAAGIRDAGFKTLDGTAIQGGAASLAVGEDICCMALPAGGKPFEIMKDVDQNAAIGDEVVVLGNAEGQGVVNTIIGRIVGIGPNLIEIDAPFVPGNSGSPIVHLKTGKVIGVATYLVTNQYDLTTNKKLKEPVVRRFGYRLDSVKGWQPVNWQAFNAQAAQMENIETLTNDLYDFFRDLDENKGVVTLGRHTNPVIKSRIDDWIASKSHHPSAEDIAEADANFVSFLKIACESDITAAQRQVTYDYFQRELADQKQTRDAMVKAFQEIIHNIGQ